MKNQLLAILVLAGGFSLKAQTLDLETCLKMADTANLTIQNSQLDIDINERQRKAYMSARLPHLAFSGDYNYNAIFSCQVIPAEHVWLASRDVFNSSIRCSVQFK